MKTSQNTPFPVLSLSKDVNRDKNFTPSPSTSLRTSFILPHPFDFAPLGSAQGRQDRQGGGYFFGYKSCGRGVFLGAK